jgi:hypothetical protein
LEKPPVVDDADVDRMINFMFGNSINTIITPEERADTAYQVAIGITRMQGRSAVTLVQISDALIHTAERRSG